MNEILLEDIHDFVQSCRFAPELSDSKVLITGGTGLIGSTLVHCLQALGVGIQMTLPVRNREKALEMYPHCEQVIDVVECDLVDYIKNLNHSFDYIIHCASPTEGRYMTEFPVETYDLAYQSTLALMEYARKFQVKGIVYLSSIEYYGQIMSDDVVTEDTQGTVDITSARSCYPMGKRAAEFLCTAYAKEYAVPVKVARLTQTLGPGVAYNDNRVFAQFTRSIINSEDIVLHTTGESAKPYLYTTDCVEALLYILLRGTPGEAYNVCNDDTYISIRDLALFLKDNFASAIKVLVEHHPEMGYAPVTRVRLSSEKLQKLGWRPHYGLYDMFERLMKSMSHNNNDSKEHARHDD